MFHLQGTLQDGTGKFDGYIDFYPNSKLGGGSVTGTITDGAFSFTIPSYLGETLNEGDYTHVEVFSIGLNYDFSLYFPNTILNGPVSGALCALSTPCAEAFGNVVSFFNDYTPSGGIIFAQQSFQTITATLQVTPEPGTFVLLGTGLTAIAASLRRRAMRRDV